MACTYPGLYNLHGTGFNVGFCDGHAAWWDSDRGLANYMFGLNMIYPAFPLPPNGCVPGTKRASACSSALAPAR